MRVPRPFKGETAEDIERDIRLAKAEIGMLKQHAPVRSGLEYLSSPKYRGRSQKDRLAEDLERAWTSEEKMQVIEHWIQKFMHGGDRRHVAEKRVMRMLREIEQEY